MTTQTTSFAVEMEESLRATPALRLPVGQTSEFLGTALREAMQQASFSRVVVGVSGGIDSALALTLAVRALGKENVLAVCMPFQDSSPESRADAEMIIQQLGVKVQTIDITPQIEDYFSRLPAATPLRRGNKMARERMSILYDLSAAEEALVLCTSNRTELLLGYGTIYGDLAGAINPVGDLYKTQIWQLAAHLDVPSPCLTKSPTADLWHGQTDEQEIGFSYKELDSLLYYMVDLQYSAKELERLGFSGTFIMEIKQRMDRTQYKHQLPRILRLPS